MDFEQNHRTTEMKELCENSVAQNPWVDLNFYLRSSAVPN
jgi:hypothetical protein